MKIITLKSNPKVYSCFSYFIRGDWNTLSDINTLIDVGTDGSIIPEIMEIYTGVGKRRVEQVIITHEHFDHFGGIKPIIKEFNPNIYAYNKLTPNTTKVYDNMDIKIGDRDAIILCTPGHSNDSICIYCEEEETLFSGDTPLFIKAPGGTYFEYFIDVLKRLTKLKIKNIYPGHDEPILGNAQDIIKFSMRNVLKSKFIR